jgi:RNA polymerase sigma-70 factor, ECF subfamily
VPALSSAEAVSDSAKLVRAAQEGDRQAFGSLYEQYARMVHGILLAHTSASEAEDLVQDVFIQALEQIGSLRDAGAFGGWLAAIARRTAHDFHRRKKIVRIEQEHAGGARADDGAFAILAMVEKLPAAYRETLILRLVEGMTGPEIAARTGMTADSVRVNLCRGMHRLREMLEG